MKFSPQQDEALKAVSAWLAGQTGNRRQWNTDRQVFYLAGYAGTGKTTLARHLADDVAGKVAFGAFTGKAALVMQSKGCFGASTIHSMIYRVKNKKARVPEWVINEDGNLKDATLAIIDECSMVDEKLGRDLLSFGKPVLVIGDPAQLPPVRGGGFFTAREPDFMLTEVHRQAAENPIIAMSMKVRTGNRLDVGSYGSSAVITRKEVDSRRVLAADQVIVGRNVTRRLYNRRIRELLNIKAEAFVKGDRIVCLKNSQSKGLLNGSIWSVKKITQQTDDATAMHVYSLDEGMGSTAVEVFAHHAFFRGTERDLDWRERKAYEEFDFGYALTCHKSQGSQWNGVLVFDESAAFGEDADRWLYTAITRAADRVEVVV